MAHRRASRTARRLPLVLLVAVIGAGGVPVRARAAGGFDHNGTGNGRHNRTNISVNSPTINRGIQHVANTNIGGDTLTQASFCKGRFRHCRFNQRIWAHSGE